MSSNHETSETFTERVDVTTHPDGAFIGMLEIDVRPGSIREADYEEELNALRDRIAELERENAELRAKRLRNGPLPIPQ
jgi:hypothetical protein